MGELVKNYYNKKTRSEWKKAGDALLYSCGVLGTAGIAGFDTIKDIFTPIGARWLIGIVLVLGFVGKFLSNFFKEEPNCGNPDCICTGGVCKNQENVEVK